MSAICGSGILALGYMQAELVCVCMRKKKERKHEIYTRNNKSITKSWPNSIRIVINVRVLRRIFSLYFVCRFRRMCLSYGIR